MKIDSQWLEQVDAAHGQLAQAISAARQQLEANRRAFELQRARVHELGVIPGRRGASSIAADIALRRGPHTV